MDLITSFSFCFGSRLIHLHKDFVGIMHEESKYYTLAQRS